MIYAIYLFAACKYNYFMESKEMLWSLPDPEFLSRAPTEGLVPLVTANFAFKKHLVAPFARSARTNYTFRLY